MLPVQGAQGSILGRGTTSHMLQLKSLPMLQGRPKISHATTKTQCSQVNKYILVFKKGKALELLLRCPSLLAIPSSSSWAPWHPSLPRTLPGHSGCWHLSRAASSWKAFCSPAAAAPLRDNPRLPPGINWLFPQQCLF